MAGRRFDCGENSGKEPNPCHVQATSTMNHDGGRWHSGRQPTTNTISLSSRPTNSHENIEYRTTFTSSNNDSTQYTIKESQHSQTEEKNNFVGMTVATKIATVDCCVHDLMMNE
jgi:hypothetical protein